MTRFTKVLVPNEENLYYFCIDGNPVESAISESEANSKIEEYNQKEAKISFTPFSQDNKQQATNKFKDKILEIINSEDSGLDI